MDSARHPLTPDEFHTIYSKVPRLTVEVVVRSEAGVLLTLRSIEPCSGLWHLPGGTVRFAEPLIDAVRRIAKRELGIEVGAAHALGYIEYPSHYENGLDCPVGIVFEVDDYRGPVEPNDEADQVGWFTELPRQMHTEQSDFLRSAVPGRFG
ncbi:MAG: NUDIX hydrolase [Actinomycetota bacterium]|nr:NUDIX hydrolase [Actinomycetota bacterium]